MAEGPCSNPTRAVKSTTEGARGLSSPEATRGKREDATARRSASGVEILECIFSNGNGR
jgi:hypothetical protein